MRKFQKKLKTAWSHSLVSSLPAKNFANTNKKGTKNQISWCGILQEI